MENEVKTHTQNTYQREIYSENPWKIFLAMWMKQIFWTKALD